VVEVHSIPFTNIYTTRLNTHPCINDYNILVKLNPIQFHLQTLHNHCWYYSLHWRWQYCNQNQLNSLLHNHCWYYSLHWWLQYSDGNPLNLHLTTTVDTIPCTDDDNIIITINTIPFTNMLQPLSDNCVTWIELSEQDLILRYESVNG
jgi:hypothetical protein